MTSEIVIMTPNAVALAADSAVTLDNRKIYNGINKLFMLSNDPPIGIMTYNNATFLNIPFETIIKEFRKYILGKDNGFSTINDFYEGFKSYLKLLLPKSDFKISFDLKFDKFKNEVDSLLLDEQFYKKVIELTLPEENLINEIYVSLNKSILKEINDFAKNIHDSMNVLDNEDLFINQFVKFSIWEMFGKNFTGIVLAGFDKERLFPSGISFKICYLYDEEYITCCFQYNEVSSKKDGDVVINTFAQHDVINTFLKTIDQNTKSQILDFFNEINKNYTNNLIELIKNNPNLDEHSKKEVLKEIELFKRNNAHLPFEFEQFIGYLEGVHVKPILESVAALPYLELSNLCESLIKVTSLKRKVQPDLETVGGDVDVAIITKGDGFIWTKRKHYFDANLNHQFFEKKNNEKL